MPDGRVSQVRFEALAFQRRTFPSAAKFKRWCTCAPPSNGLLIPSFLALTAVWYTRFYQAEPAPVVGTTKCPESLLPDVGVTFIRETCTPPPGTLLPVPSSYGLIRQSPVALPYFGVWPRSRSLCRLLPALLPPGSSRRYLCESFLRCLSPYPGGLLSAFAWFFLSLHRPSPSFDRVGFPPKSANTIFHGSAFEAAAISLCSGLQVCSPPRSFLPQQVSLQGSRGSLHPSRTCVVTFARIGHTIRPTTGNWRNEDFHLARFAALSAAHE
jgi:hypothetical protein